MKKKKLDIILPVAFILLSLSCHASAAEEEREPDKLPEITGGYTVERVAPAEIGIVSPSGLCVYGDEVYICDYEDGKIVVTDLELNPVRTFGKIGMGEGEFSHPTDITVYQDELYVLDAGSSRAEIVKTDGTYTGEIGLTMLDRQGYGDYYSIEVNGAGRIAVSADKYDTSAARVRLYTGDEKVTPKGQFRGCLFLYEDVFYAADMLEYCKVSPTSSVYITGTNYLYEVTDEELVQKAELPYKYEPTDMLALGKEIYGVSGSFGRIDRFSEDGEVQEGIAQLPTSSLKLRFAAETSNQFYVTDQENNQIYYVHK
ncbi:MAG: hypothetical protein ACLRTT_16320 [Lachnospiraceae bacterium]